jgi:LacI family transcriptional regulator
MTRIMSIARIAQSANVPYATAWRVINNRPVSSPAAVEAVQAAMRRMQYVPRKTRRGRPPKAVDGIRTHNVALLHLREGTLLSSEILSAVQKRLLDRNLNLIFAQVDRLDALPQAVKAGNVDGILGYGAFPENVVPEGLRKIPAVWLMTRNDDEPDPWGDRVRPDHAAIGRLAAQYLLERGHQRVAYFNPRPGMPFYDERGHQFGRIIREKQGSLDPFLADAYQPNVPETEWLDAAAESLVSQWLACTQRPTGVFCPVDRLTARVHACLVRAGVCPGRDVEMVSCDNQTDLLALLRPKPASVDLNRTTIARLAVDRLFWRMRNGLASPSIVITVTPTLKATGAAFHAADKTN